MAGWERGVEWARRLEGMIQSIHTGIGDIAYAYIVREKGGNERCLDVVLDGTTKTPCIIEESRTHRPPICKILHSLSIDMLTR